MLLEARIRSPLHLAESDSWHRQALTSTPVSKLEKRSASWSHDCKGVSKVKGK